MTSLTDLGEDIIAFGIATHLAPRDVAALGETCRTLHQFLSTNSAYHMLYLKKFGTSKPTPLNLKEYNWYKLFRLRVSPKVQAYTWGTLALGRLGYYVRDAPTANVGRSQFTQVVHTPWHIANFSDVVISDISAGGYSFQILTGLGDVYYTGVSWKGAAEISYLAPGPYHAQDYRPPLSYSSSTAPVIRMPFIGSVAGRRLLVRPPHIMPVDDIEGPSVPPGPTPVPETLRHPTPRSVPESPIKETNFVTRALVPQNRPLVAVSSGRQHFIALDADSRIYTWDTGNVSATGVWLDFGIAGSVEKVCAGWNLSAAHFVGHGIVVWYGRDQVSKQTHEDGLMRAKPWFVTIPDTKQVGDFVTLSDFVLFIKNGILYRFDLHAELYARAGELPPNTPFEVTQFNQWLALHNEETHGEAVFTKLDGCFKSFAVFTNDGHVLLGDKDTARLVEEDEEDPHQWDPRVIPELQGKNINHVVQGDYHSMALTDDGDLLSWGTESNLCGCLGLGTKDENLEKSGVEDLGARGFHASKPIPVKKPSSHGKWLVAAAAGWHSGGLFLEEPSGDLE